jgi:hypothetical protein
MRLEACVMAFCSWDSSAWRFGWPVWAFGYISDAVSTNELTYMSECGFFFFHSLATM